MGMLYRYIRTIRGDAVNISSDVVLFRRLLMPLLPSPLRGGSGWSMPAWIYLSVALCGCEGFEEGVLRLSMSECACHRKAAEHSHNICLSHAPKWEKLKPKLS